MMTARRTYSWMLLRFSLANQQVEGCTAWHSRQRAQLKLGLPRVNAARAEVSMMKHKGRTT